LRGKSKELGYRRDSYLEHMGKATGSQKVTFQQRADVCDAWSVHYEQEAEKVEMAPTGDEHICVPPPRISSDSFLYA
jgi:hypothetical protein